MLRDPFGKPVTISDIRALAADMVDAKEKRRLRKDDAFGVFLDGCRREQEAAVSAMLANFDRAAWAGGVSARPPESRFGRARRWLRWRWRGAREAVARGVLRVLGVYASDLTDD